MRQGFEQGRNQCVNLRATIQDDLFTCKSRLFGRKQCALGGGGVLRAKRYGEGARLYGLKGVGALSVQQTQQEIGRCLIRANRQASGDALACHERFALPTKRAAADGWTFDG
jgi:hypothetical protein